MIVVESEEFSPEDMFLIIDNIERRNIFDPILGLKNKNMVSKTIIGIDLGKKLLTFPDGIAYGNNKIKIYREIRNSLLGFEITSVESFDKGQMIASYNEKGLTRKSLMSGIKTRGKRKTANNYKRIH